MNTEYVKSEGLSVSPPPAVDTGSHFLKPGPAVFYDLSAFHTKEMTMYAGQQAQSTLGAGNATREQATAASNVKLAEELGSFLVETMNEARTIADALDGGGLEKAGGAQVQPVPSGLAEQQAQVLRDCLTVAREIRGQLQRIHARI